MPRLFITERELNFISDITKEFMKDINGQKIFYYAVSESRTQGGFYGESKDKVWHNPVEIDAIVDAETGMEVTVGKSSIDTSYTRKVFLHRRDILEKGINISTGDFFSFGDAFYEIATVISAKNMFGFAERQIGYEVTGIKARESLFKAPLQGPTDESRPEDNAIQTVFTQSRGENVDARGNPTGDVRDLVKSGALDKPLTSPAEVSSLGDPDEVGNAFYGDK